MIGCFLENLPDEPNRANGALAPYGAAAAIEFLQLDEAEENPSVAALKNDYFALGLWNNLFGFPDSYHLNVAQ